MLRAYLVLGPESSGTRFVTRLLISAGCYGDDGHQQRWDTEAPAVSPIVWRRSFPHADIWPDIGLMLERLHGYEVKALVTVRDHYCMTASQQGFQTPEAIADNGQQAYLRIFQGLADCGVWHLVVSYEALCLEYERYARYLLRQVGLNAEQTLPVFKNGNTKYYA